MQEQAPLFLLSLWMFALVLPDGADRAATLGWTYLAFRALYPAIWLFIGGEDGAPFPQMFISTFPQYAINFYMAFSVLMAYGQSEDTEDWFKHDLVGVLVFTIIYLMYPPVLMKVNGALSGFFAPPSESAKTPAGSEAVATSEGAAESEA